MSEQKKPRLPKLKPVKSSTIKAIGHEGNMLTIEFGNGGIYQYAGVTADQFRALEGAESIGNHFAAAIRNKFKGVKYDVKQ